MKKNLKHRQDFFMEDPALQNLKAPLNLPEGETLGFTTTKGSYSRLTLDDKPKFPSFGGVRGGQKVTNESTFNALHKSETRIISVELKKIEAQEHPKYQTANSKTYRFIKEFKDELNRNPTEPERIMWKLLRNKNSGFKIRRQHIIDDFIVDFVCISKKLIIEIDGNIHLYQQEYDEERMFRLRNSGFEVIRFSNEEVLSNSTLVLLKIKEKLNQK